MCHIKTDKRSQTSAALIAQGLLRCMESKDFAKITITDVQQESTVGRATFYRLFDTLPDVLAYLCDQAFEEALATVPHRAQTTRQMIVSFTSFWMDHWRLAEAILQSGRLDILHASNQKYLRQMIRTVNRSAEYSAVQLDYIAGILSAILAVWVQNGKQESPALIVEQLTQVAGNLTRALQAE